MTSWGGGYGPGSDKGRFDEKGNQAYQGQNWSRNITGNEGFKSKPGQGIDKAVEKMINEASAKAFKAKRLQTKVAKNMTGFMEDAVGVATSKGRDVKATGIKARRRAGQGMRQAGRAAMSGPKAFMRGSGEQMRFLGSEIAGSQAGLIAQDIGMVGGAAGRAIGRGAGAVGGMAQGVRDRVGGMQMPYSARLAGGMAMEGAQRMSGMAMGAGRAMGRMGGDVAGGIGRGARAAGGMAAGTAKNTGKAMKFLGGQGPKMFKKMKEMGGKGMGMMGISLSLSSLLRQSQIFTGTIGSLFQIIGGFIDVLLAPFMPLFASAMEWVAKGIPYVQKYAQMFYDWLEQEVFPLIQGIAEWAWGKIKELWDILQPHVDTVIKWTTDLWEWLKIDGLGWITGTLWPKIEPAAKWIADAAIWWNTAVWNVFKEWVKLEIKFAVAAWEWIESTGWPAVQSVIDYVSDDIWPLVTGLWETVKIWGKEMWDIVSVPVVEAWEKFKTTIGPIIEEAKPIIMDIIANLKAMIKPYIEMLIAILEEIILPLIKLLVKFIMWVLGKIWGWLMKFLGWFWDNIGKGVLQALKWVTSKLPGIFQAITAFIRDPMKYLVQWAAFILDKVIGFMDFIAAIDLPLGIGKPFEGVMDALGRGSLQKTLGDLNSFLDAKDQKPGIESGEGTITVNIKTVDPDGAISQEQTTFDSAQKNAEVDTTMTATQIMQEKIETTS